MGECKHLGNLLESKNSMKRDITVKRGKFIGQINSLSQEFFYVSTFMNILNIYTVSFHGSGLWDLFSSDCAGSIKHGMWLLDMLGMSPTLIELISGSLHPKVMLASRYCGFVKYMLPSPKYPVRVLANMRSSDRRTVMLTSATVHADLCNS